MKNILIVDDNTLAVLKKFVEKEMLTNKESLDLFKAKNAIAKAETEAITAIDILTMESVINKALGTTLIVLDEKKNNKLVPIVASAAYEKMMEAEQAEFDEMIKKGW